MGQKLSFVEKKGKINIFLHDTSQPDLMLGYINQNNVFFPNNNMMFHVEWMVEIANYMQASLERAYLKLYKI